MEEMKQEKGFAVLPVSQGIFSALDIQIEETNTQGELRKKGTFDALKQVLLLPASYTVEAVFYRPLSRVWHVVVSSPDLPLPKEGEMIPLLEAKYKADYQKDGTKIPRLVSIGIGRGSYYGEW